MTTSPSAAGRSTVVRLPKRRRRTSSWSSTMPSATSRASTCTAMPAGVGHLELGTHVDLGGELDEVAVLELGDLDLGLGQRGQLVGGDGLAVEARPGVVERLLDDHAAPEALVDDHRRHLAAAEAGHVDRARDVGVRLVQAGLEVGEGDLDGDLDPRGAELLDGAGHGVWDSWRDLGWRWDGARTGTRRAPLDVPAYGAPAARRTNPARPAPAQRAAGPVPVVRRRARSGPALIVGRRPLDQGLQVEAGRGLEHLQRLGHVVGHLARAAHRRRRRR